MELLLRSKLLKSIRMINGLERGNLTRALAGENVGTVIRASAWHSVPQVVAWNS